MLEKWEISWSDKFVTGNKEIDDFHKQIIDGISELYEMLKNTDMYKEEISLLTKKLEQALLIHMDIEINYLKRFDLDWVKHEASHNVYKNKIDFYKHYYVPPIIRAVLVSEVTHEYMKKHFFEFDLNDLIKINEKINELEK